MVYEVMNRSEASIATIKEVSPDTAIISITDYGDERNNFRKQPWLKFILELQFNDVDEGGHRCITLKQAKEIADFALRVYGKVERFIIHCEFGQSRSAGVAAAISTYFEGHDSGIFTNPAYFPNRTCYRYVLEALRRGTIHMRA